MATNEAPEDVWVAGADAPLVMVGRGMRARIDKSQVKIESDPDIEACWTEMGAPIGILEGLVDFSCELSVIVARSGPGVLATLPRGL